MTSKANYKILKLNKNFAPIGVSDWQSIVVKLYSQTSLVSPVRIQEAANEDGKSQLSVFEVVRSMDDWEKLEPEGTEHFVHTANDTFVLPKVVICHEFDKLPFGRALFPTKKNIFERDNHTCCYTGKKLSRDELSVDHVLPSSRGGGNTWENLVTCDRLLNSQKGDRTPEEFGLKLLWKPTKPKNGLAFDFFESEWEFLIKG